MLIDRSATDITSSPEAQPLPYCTSRAEPQVNSRSPDLLDVVIVYAKSPIVLPLIFTVCLSTLWIWAPMPSIASKSTLISFTSG